MRKVKVPTEYERNLEAVAMNIVYQLGDLLYDNLPKVIAHDYFVDARQATNDRAIKFTKKLVKMYSDKQIDNRIKHYEEMGQPRIR